MLSYWHVNSDILRSRYTIVVQVFNLPCVPTTQLPIIIYTIWQIIRHHAFNQIWSKIRPREQLQKELIIHEDASNVEIELIEEMYYSWDGTNPNVKSIAFLKNNHWYKTSKWKFKWKIRLKVTVLRPLLFSVQCWAKEPQTQSKNCIRWKTMSLVLRLSWSTEITRLQIENQLTVRLIIEVT